MADEMSEEEQPKECLGAGNPACFRAESSHQPHRGEYKDHLDRELGGGTFTEKAHPVHSSREHQDGKEAPEHALKTAGVQNVNGDQHRRGSKQGRRARPPSEADSGRRPQDCQYTAQQKAHYVFSAITKYQSGRSSLWTVDKSTFSIASAS